MKRIFSLLIVAVLLCSLAISASAATFIYYNFNGVRLPVPPNTWAKEETYYYILKEYNDNYTLVSSSVRMQADEDENAFFGEDGHLSYYALTPDGTTWELFGENDFIAGSFPNIYLRNRLHWSNTSVLNTYDKVGPPSLYFQGEETYSSNPMAPHLPDNGAEIEEVEGDAWYVKLWNAILSIPKTIIEGIASIIVPDFDVINEKFTSFLEELKMKFNFDTEFFETVLSSEQPVTDIEGDYHISGVGDFHLTFFDTQFLVDGVTFFRPFIRGFIILLLALYNIKMLLGFIRQDAGVVTGTLNPEDGKKKE